MPFTPPIVAYPPRFPIRQIMASYDTNSNAALSLAQGLSIGIDFMPQQFLGGQIGLDAAPPWFGDDAPFSAGYEMKQMVGNSIYGGAYCGLGTVLVKIQGAIHGDSSSTPITVATFVCNAGVPASWDVSAVPLEFMRIVITNPSATQLVTGLSWFYGVRGH